MSNLNQSVEIRINNTYKRSKPFKVVRNIECVLLKCMSAKGKKGRGRGYGEKSTKRKGESRNEKKTEKKERRKKF